MPVKNPIRWVRTRARALRKQPFLCGMVAFVICTIFCADVSLIAYLRQQAVDYGATSARNLAYVLAEQTDKSLQSIRLLTTDVVEQLEGAHLSSVDELENIASGPAYHSMLREKLSGLASLDAITITSARGRPVSGSASPTRPLLDLSDREYISAAQLAKPGELYVSAPVRSRVTGSWRLVLSQRITGVDGEFLGVVSGVVELSSLEQMYSEIILGPNGSITLARRDGVLLARYPRAEGMIGASLSSSTGVFGVFEPGERTAVSRHISVVDGRDRIHAAQKTAHFPIVIVVTTAVDDVLAGWRRQTASVTSIGLGAIAVLVLLALVLARSTEKLTTAETDLVRAQEQAKAQELLTAAMSNMRQGLAMFDAGGNLIVCNQQYARLYKLPPEVTKVGTPRELIRAHRKVRGTYPCSIERRGAAHQVNVLEDGRIIEIARQVMNGGGWVSTHEDVTDKRRAEEDILEAARRDPLTQLPNRLLFHERLQAALENMISGEEIAVHYLDLDRFKRVNDTLGHAVGDILLQAVAKRLENAMRSSDVLARLGGDEFAIIQNLENGRDDAAALALRVAALLKRPFKLRDHSIQIGSSIGIALAPADALDADLIVRNADLALYAAKALGRETHQFFKREMDQEAQHRMRLEQELRGALDLQQMELHYQPQVRLSDGQLVGFEALLRWRHPERGLLAPGEFIDLAEETGIIRELGEWAIVEACSEATKWPNHLRIAVNVSVAQLRSDTLHACVEKALTLSGLSPNRLELEVTESVMLTEAEANISALSALRSLGVKFSMDDFGTGYSSLSCLRLFPFDKLKIDRCFVAELGVRKDCAAIVKSAAGLAQSLGMSTTAEGIETAEQLAGARRAGCTEGQGYLFGRPVPPERIKDLFASKYDVRAA